LQEGSGRTIEMVHPGSGHPHKSVYSTSDLSMKYLFATLLGGLLFKIKLTEHLKK
jgi:hypothetical protein